MNRFVTYPRGVRRGLALGLVVGAMALSSIAHANPYEIPIDIDSEEELYDLFNSGQLDDDTLELLVDLFRRGVDLNAADRERLYALPNLTYEEVDAILAYREEAGAIADPAALVAAGVLSRERLESIASFLVVRDASRSLAATDGFVRLQSAWTLRDERVPPFALQARVHTARHLTVGAAATLTRNRIGEVAWDPNRDALSAEEASAQIHVPKYFVSWETPKWGAIAGTYRIGFGQRLTFDNTSRYTPNGFVLDDALVRGSDLVRLCREAAGELPESPCADAAGDVYATPDWRWRDGLRGAAVGAHRLEVRQGWLQLYAWGTHERRDIYQYEIYDRRACDDPRDDADECSAPQVFVRNDDDLLAPSSRHTFQSLPGAFDEAGGGGNVAWFANRRAHVGVTGYGHAVQWRYQGADLDFQEWSRLPYGGPFGAVGADAAWGKKWADVFLEVSRSVDSTPREHDGGGGYAGLLRSTGTWGPHEVELSGRWYDRRFANPYARPIAAPDEYEGLRARDEAGGRVRYTGLAADKKLTIRALVDAWAAPTESQPKLRAQARADWLVLKWFRPGLWAEYQNRDLRTADRDQCYEVSVEEDENGEPIPCEGERIRATGRLYFYPHKRFSFGTQYDHEWLDDPAYTDHFRQDVAATLQIASQPVDGFRIRARGRYRFEDIEDPTSEERSIWGWLEFSYDWNRTLLTRLRYDIRAFTDDRTSTGDRDPNPEHWLRLELRVRF